MIGGVTTLRASLFARPRAALAVVALSLLAIACAAPGTTSTSTSPPATVPSVTLYSAVEITASWQGGATGSPTQTKAFIPSTHPGQLCPATTLTLLYNAHGSDLQIGDGCSIPISYAVCFPQGAGQLVTANGGSATCATDPLQTSFNQFLFGGVSTGPVVDTAISLPANPSLILFYCDTGSTFTAPPLSSSVGCLGK